MATPPGFHDFDQGAAMTKLGLWAPFINEQEMRGWYDLSTELDVEARRYRPNGREMDALSVRAYDALHQRTVAYARRSTAPFSPAYHNDSMHFAAVEALGLAAADLYAQGDPRRMPLLVRQALGLALRTHDAHHCGSTFRATAPRGVYEPGLGVNVATEWVTAQAINTFMRQHGLNLPARLFQTGVIWSSTYGGGSPMGRRLRIPNPQPTTVWGAIMRAADVCPPRSFRIWLLRTIAVNYGEIPAEPAAQTLNGFVASCEAFAGYIERCFVQLDSLSGMSLTTKLGWRDRLTSLRRGVDVLKQSQRWTPTILRETRRYGVDLG